MSAELKAKVLKVADLLEYQEGSVVSREIIRKETEEYRLFLMHYYDEMKKTINNYFKDNTFDNRKMIQFGINLGI